MQKTMFFCGGSAIAVAASLCAFQAVAATDSTDATASANTGATVSELVVVAEKRAEKIETVPVAVTAFSAKERDIIGIKTVQELSDFTPGLSYYAIADRAYIRGIGRNTTTLGTAAGVAVYYNGIYYGANGSVSLQHDSLFIGNIEVDRGPQNTLHGSNADGGVIDYIEKRPTDSYYAEARFGVGNYGYYYGEAVVSGPISDNWRFRLGGSYSSEGGGYFKNFDGPPEGGSGPQGGGGDWRYLEAQLEGTIGDHLDVWAMASSGDFDSNFHTVATVGAIPETYQDGPASPLTPSNFFGLCGLNGGAGQPYASQCSATTTTNLFGQSITPTVVPGSVVADPVVASQFPGDNPSTANPHDFIETSHQLNSQNDDIALATTWTYHFPDMDLEYLGGFQQFYYHLLFGAGVDSGVLSYQIQGPPGYGNATIYPAGEHTLFDEHEQSFSNELDLTSTTKGPLQYLLGLYQYHEHFNQPIGAFCFPNQTQLFNPVTLTGTAAAPNSDGCAFNEDGDITYDDYAGFAHVAYKFNDQFELTGGLRYTADQRAGYETQRLIDFDGLEGAYSVAVDVTPLVDASILDSAPPANAGPASILANGDIYRTLSASWSALTGDTTLNWTPDSTTLAYFRYARGYKAGGFAAGAFEAVPATKPEYVDSFEVGLKKTIGSQFQANAAAFYYNFQNDQQPFGVATPGGVISEIFNIPTVREYGLEVEGVWKPVDPITLNLQYSYLNTRVTNAGACVVDADDPFATLPGANTSGCTPVYNVAGDPSSGVKDRPQNLTGAELPEAPPNKVSFNGQYVFKFNAGNLTFSGSYIWKDKTYGEIWNRPGSLAPAYSTVNLRATWDDAKDRYTIILYANNVFNTLGYDNVTYDMLNTPTAANPKPLLVTAEGLVAPFTVGAEFQLRFR